MPPPISRATNRLKVKLLIQAAAKTGIAVDLVNYILAAEDCDTYISASVVHLLRSNPTPLLRLTSPSEDWYTEALGAEAAITVIFAQCRVILSKAVPKNGMAQLLRENYTALLLWFRFFVDDRTWANKSYSGPGIGIGCFLCLMLAIDEDLTKDIMSCRITIDIILILWGLTSDDGSYFVGNHSQDLDCPIVEILKIVVLHDTGRHSLLALLNASTSNIRRVVRPMKHRVQELVETQLYHMSASDGIQTIGDFIHLADALTRCPEDLPEDLVRLFYTPGFIFAICCVSCTVLDRRTDSAPLSSQALTEILWFICTAALRNNRCESNPMKKVKAAIDGGVFNLIVETIRYLPPRSNQSAALLSFLAEMVAYAAYPEVLLSLEEAHSELQEGEGSNHKYLKLALECIAECQSYRRWMAVAVAGKKPFVCHCLLHDNTGFAPEGSKSKKCSRCNLAVYCSAHCQRLDWEGGHRERCVPNTQHGSHANKGPRLQVQASQVAFVQQFVSFTFRKVEEKYRKEEIPAEEILPQLAQEPNVHLVDAWFPWGELEINLFIRLKRVGRNDFRPLSTTVFQLSMNGCSGNGQKAAIPGSQLTKVSCKALRAIRSGGRSNVSRGFQFLDSPPLHQISFLDRTGYRSESGMDNWQHG
ncbi:hypothetical protein FA13DRAFT_1714413 [Coprinellus micaceus]|uniref:MYND-type domain-containing protein n=1 Tax=Coprinellus micaceus TaxID=71717 RepID=A0A4Y7SSZ2_COPMI|nr:hypothetical protein FA13DRAFT_1714413 [Coprinellus micaceus]